MHCNKYNVFYFSLKQKDAEKRLRKSRGRKGSKQSRASALSGGSGLEDYNEVGYIKVILYKILYFVYVVF